MTPDNIITSGSPLLQPFLNAPPPSFSELLDAFIRQQTAAWPMLRRARRDLDTQMVKKVQLFDRPVHLHHNPRRIKSSAAKVDQKSIDRRPCFLCPDQLYEKQLGLSWHENWLVLNNPFPIFKDHLVVSSKDHLVQNAREALPAITDFVEDSGFSFCAFYNGPACGASAPDHLHFQACRNKDLPIIGQLENIFSSTGLPGLIPIDNNGSGTAYMTTLDSRGMLICISPEKESVLSRMLQALSFLKKQTGACEEPLVNILLYGASGRFTGILFPRKTHRPKCFFRKDTAKMLISPGTVDICGAIILPRREDYDRIDTKQVRQIYFEVCLDDTVFENLSFSDMD